MAQLPRAQQVDGSGRKPAGASIGVERGDAAIRVEVRRRDGVVVSTAAYPPDQVFAVRASSTGAGRVYVSLAEALLGDGDAFELQYDARELAKGLAQTRALFCPSQPGEMSERGAGGRDTCNIGSAGAAHAMGQGAVLAAVTDDRDSRWRLTVLNVVLV
ncbi:hypothetical protein T492DRAFT_948821 [Pavlovales sp. CCMP2436]|nr:hypothetical protein T492DRAFT_948821 [Pavlovales sp. CCMP2436]